ncbi:MAG: glycosyltransferase family 4 protein [Corynebacteriales bacterium]|nr:glycosyltransferase family 4 protein [Mycobacteriales bacterium]
MAEPLRVALVLATSTGGVGTHVRSLAAHLGKLGHQVVVCGPAATEDVFHFTEVGAQFHPVNIATGLNPLHDAKAVVALRKALNSTRAQVIHAHGYRAGLIAHLARAKKPRPVPLTVTWHNVLMATGAKHAVLARLERIVARGANITLGASEDLVERAIGLGAPDVRFAPVAAPLLAQPERDATQVRVELDARDRPLVLSVGRLHPQKGFDVLVRAAARLSRRDRPPMVVIAGSGPEEDNLRLLAQELNAPVRFLGRRSDIADLIAACDIAVVTSPWEARQLFAQEVLQAGKPLVATAVGGIPGLVGNGARLIPAGDVNAVEEAVAALLDDPTGAEQLAERGKAQAKTWPTEAETTAMAVAVYAELLGVPA